MGRVDAVIQLLHYDALMSSLNGDGGRWAGSATFLSSSGCCKKKYGIPEKKTKLYSPRWTQYGSSMENGSQECRMTALLQSIGEVQSNKLWPYFSFNLNAGGQLFRTVSSGSDERR